MTVLGPVEYIVIRFPGNQFTGDIAPAIADLVDNRTVRILDLVFVMKEADGSVTSIEFDQLDELEVFADIEGDVYELLNDDDVLALAEALPDNSSALMVVWEDLWAADLAKAVRDAGGELVDGGRIPWQVIQGALEQLEDEA